MLLSRYCKIYPHREDPTSVVMLSTKTASNIILPEAMLKDIESGSITDEEKETLTNLGFIVNDHASEKSEMLRLIEELNAEDHVFKATAVMNLNCNLGCVYCFEGNRKGNFYMSRETAEAFVEFAINNIRDKHKEELQIVFYGGEPLLSIDLIEYISGRLKNFSEENKITYKASIVTNGTLLTRSYAARLQLVGIKDAAITLDGPEYLHNASRPFLSGSGSFKTIVQNIKDVGNILSIQLNGNYTGLNYREFPHLLDFLSEQGLTPEFLPMVRFGPVSRETPDVAPPNFHGGCDCFNEQWVIDASIFLGEEIMKRGYAVPKLIPAPCMVQLKDRLYVNYDGAFYKCPGFIGREDFRVGDVKTGLSDYRQSHNLDNWKNEECLNCAYLPLCFGGCRYMKLVRERNMEGIDCRKPYFDAVLESLVKQDIAYKAQK
ncbi:MAG: geopeptide radical SAM maturase [Dissulfurispiraceae bacterium]